MEGAAKLITSVAALLAAIAWPLVLAVILFTFRNEIRSSVSRLPTFLDRLRKMKVAGVEAELDAVAESASVRGDITAAQTRAAAHIAIDSRDLGTDYLFAELDKLCLQYDTLRRTMPAGPGRTREMTRVVVKMRALGPATSNRIAAYKGAGSAGNRLAAIAMMQMEPAKADLDWLVDRFRSEAPFVFFHASLALTNAAAGREGTSRLKVLDAARTALAIVLAFEGPSDENTIEVLENLIE